MAPALELQAHVSVSHLFCGFWNLDSDTQVYMTSHMLAVPSPWLWLPTLLHHSLLSIGYDSDQENDFASLPSLSSFLSLPLPFLPPAFPLSSLTVLCLKELLLEDHTFSAIFFRFFFLCVFFFICFSTGGFSLHFSHFLKVNSSLVLKFGFFLVKDYCSHKSSKGLH